MANQVQALGRDSEGFRAVRVRFMVLGSGRPVANIMMAHPNWP